MPLHAIAVLSLAAPPPHAAVQDPAVAAPPASEQRIEREMLGNGLEVLSLADPTLGERVFGTLFVRCGRLDEIEGQEGAAELLVATWIPGGSEKHDGAALQAWLAEHDALLVASASTDHLSIDFQCAPADLAELYARLGTLIATPRYPEAELAAAREALADAVAEDEDELDAYRVLERHALTTTLRSGRVATRASVLAISRQELVFFHRAFLLADRMLLGLAGAVDRRALDAARNFALALPAMETARRDWSTALGTPARTTVLLAEGEPHLWVVAPAPGAGEADFALFAWALTGAYYAGEPPPEVAARRREAGLLDLRPRLVLAPSEWLYSSLRVDAAIDPARAGAALAELARSFAADRLAALAPLARAVAELPAPRETPSSRRRIEQALLDSIRAPAQWKPRLEPSADDLAAAAGRWVDPARLWALATGPVDELARTLAPACDVLVLDATRTVASTPEGLAALARLFEALGGRERWARLGSLATEGEVALAQGEPIRTRQVRDLAGSRLWQEQTRAGSVDVTVLDASGATTYRGGTAISQPDEMHSRLVRRSACHLFQLLHDLALGAGRGARVADDGALEVLAPEGRLCWIELDDAGRPRRLGVPPDRSGDGAVFVYGDWGEFQGYPYPATIDQPAVGLRTRTRSLEVDVPLDEQLFRRAQSR